VYDDVFEIAVLQSKASLFQNVHRLIYKKLSNMDRSYLQAMSFDGQISMVKDIRERMDVDTNVASTYRSRLIAAGLIRDAGHGLVSYNLPFMHDFLNENAN
jgi:hypothetical protein